MISRQEILELMPEVNGKNKVEYGTIVNGNIIKTIHRNMPKAVQITAPIAKYFQGSTVEETCSNIWNFLKSEIRYIKDGENQDIKLPNRFLYDGTGDCKSYSLFAGSILQNLGIDKAFRYTSYSVDPTPQHVYVVALTGTKTKEGKSSVVITDGVWHQFNKQKPYTFKKDFMPIRTLSGTDDIGKLSLKSAAKAVQKAGSKIQDKIKDTAVVKKGAEVQDKIKDKAEDVKEAVKSGAGVIAKKGAEILKNVAPGAKMILGAPARRAFRTLVAINFHDYANKLKSNPDTRSKWESLGGSWRELQESIDAGVKRKSILGIGCLDCQVKVNGIGEPVSAATIAAIVVAATPVIIALSTILKEVISTINAAKGKTDTELSPGGGWSAGGNTNIPGGGVNNSGNNSGSGAGGGSGSGGNASGSGYNSGSDYYPGSDEYRPPSGEDSKPPEKKDNTAALVAAAVAAKLLFF